ncbi:hypothetical protein Pmar_PMAR003509 [Perkinsus marinus ATCC 50983]|uniref:subtilisin n=1 Tax=Perkinsus marinus (strain ATCC 50983 / TXsc) TaxID=423536 RepID=C5KHI3_PERM5|nr:hypothetical protein Pmar_PMAR003509 [Perkinsus marinus ATCC 50983]EER16045.1 hypothetical protein Pmar_PMAR003509 [Perkinsus marinus ATCC 50983]|eukprot:XP_002784249.1 hypothetical protein Pmar_PMAR003509 [Perkinsus marinus ATCC 50983]
MQLLDGRNFGSAVDIAAPGYERVEEKYATATGISDATAFVAGIAGMLYTLEPSVEPKLTLAYVKSIIMDTAEGIKDSKEEKTLSFGRVNAATAQ